MAHDPSSSTSTAPASRRLSMSVGAHKRSKRSVSTRSHRTSIVAAKRLSRVSPNSPAPGVAPAFTPDASAPSDPAMPAPAPAPGKKLKSLSLFARLAVRLRPPRAAAPFAPSAAAAAAAPCESGGFGDRDARLAALRERGLLPQQDLSTLEAAQDARQTVVVPAPAPAVDDGVSAARQIQQEWRRRQSLAPEPHTVEALGSMAEPAQAPPASEDAAAAAASAPPGDSREPEPSSPTGGVATSDAAFWPMPPATDAAPPAPGAAPAERIPPSPMSATSFATAASTLPEPGAGGSPSGTGKRTTTPRRQAPPPPIVLTPMRGASADTGALLSPTRVPLPASPPLPSPALSASASARSFAFLDAPPSPRRLAPHEPARSRSGTGATLPSLSSASAGGTAEDAPPVTPETGFAPFPVPADEGAPLASVLEDEEAEACAGTSAAPRSPVSPVMPARAPARIATAPPMSAPTRSKSVLGGLGRRLTGKRRAAAAPASPVSPSSAGALARAPSTRVAVQPKLHDLGSLLTQTRGIEDDEERRLAEMAFIDF